MHFIIDTAKVMEVFCFIEDFYQEVQQYFFTHPLPKNLRLVAKIRRNMKNMLLTLTDKLNLMKRGGIEAVNDILMSVCDTDHTPPQKTHQRLGAYPLKPERLHLPRA